MKEIWRCIRGYKDYQVSNLGRIKSLKRKGVRTDRFLTSILNYNGYLCVNLYKDKKKKQVKVHRLVAQEFIPNKRGYPDINHKNGVKCFNEVHNLEWTTPKKDMEHADKVLGIDSRGKNNGQAKLTEEQVYGIRDLLKIKLPQRKIAKMYNVVHSTTGRISRNKNWRSLPCNV